MPMMELKPQRLGSTKRGRSNKSWRRVLDQLLCGRPKRRLQKGVYKILFAMISTYASVPWIYIQGGQADEDTSAD